MAKFSWLRRALTWLVVLLLVQGLLWIIYREVQALRQPPRAFHVETLSRTPRLPSLTLEDPQQQASSLRTEEPRWRLLHAWASWCLPCRTELPSLLSLDSAFPNLELITLSLDEDWAAVSAFFKGPIPASVRRDPSGILQDRFEFSALPDTYLISPDGTARFRFHGPRDWQSPEARAWLSATLGTATP